MNIAFFDVDGTLLPHPSLERRLFWRLLRHRKIPPMNYFRWAAEMVRLSATNLTGAAQSNKTYLRGISSNVLSDLELQQCRCIPEFFPAAIQRIWWHASRRDEIVLVTGTLAPLAEIVKAALERELLWRGVETQIAVIATHLVTRNDRLTGRVDGVPMFGEPKATAAREFASSRDVPWWKCFAYGNHALDRPLLEAVGNPIAVNPSSQLRRIALKRGWQVMQWRPFPRPAALAHRLLKWKGEPAR